MFVSIVRQVTGLALLSCLAVGAVFSPARSETALLRIAQGSTQHSGPSSAPGARGHFDFYVLSLSWSPTFCADAADRDRSGGPQCGPRPFAFVVHGLWPQYERGFPEYCQVPPPRLYHGIVASMLDLMPAPRLIYNEWDRHGTCSGLGPQAYFDTVRKAREAVAIPPEYNDLRQPLSVTPDAVAQAFIKANPGLTPNGIAIECSRNRMSEVRLCLTKDLHLRDCPEIAKNSCRRDRVVMPPVRGGT